MPLTVVYRYVHRQYKLENKKEYELLKTIKIEGSINMKHRLSKNDKEDTIYYQVEFIRYIIKFKSITLRTTDEEKDPLLVWQNILNSCTFISSSFNYFESVSTSLIWKILELALEIFFPIFTPTSHNSQYYTKFNILRKEA